VFVKEKIKNKKIKANIAVASITASRARIRLYNAFLEVINNNGRILYTDTDSIFACFKQNPYKME
jgi:DNA polymerase elongation subunit (family B)